MRLSTAEYAERLDEAMRQARQTEDRIAWLERERELLRAVAYAADRYRLAVRRKRTSDRERETLIRAILAWRDEAARKGELPAWKPPRKRRK